MHGVRRGARPSPEVLRQERERSSFHADLIRRALLVRAAPLKPPLEKQFNSEYEVVQRALEANPDEYTLWSFRREVLLARMQDSACIDDDWRSELDLTTRALKKHPKAYPAWQHRLWLLEDETVGLKVTEDVRARAIREEQQLSALMLAADGRNFHGWAHRMRVKTIQNSSESSGSERDLGKELRFIEQKINEDFANYSAWHHRSALLPQIYSEPQEFLSRELEFVRQAFYTEPDVQSAWFYYRWLIAGAPARGMKAVVIDKLVEEELAACEELLTIEPEARFALQTKVHLLLQLKRGSEALNPLQKLEQIDPMRKGYYRYLRAKIAESEPSP